MQFPMAKRTQTLTNSFVRKILALTNKPEVISFAGGLPDASLFPHESIEKVIHELLAANDTSIYQYSPTKGYAPLLARLAQEYRAQGIQASEETMLITTGSQQSLDLICKMMLDPQSVVITEDPTYLAALQLFRVYEATIKAVPTDEEGPDLNVLETLFAQEDVRFFYTIPTFQNPTGFTCTQEKRQAIADLAKRYGVLIVEDNPYGKLRYEGTEPVSYGTLLPEQTIVLGTASKIAVPDFRLGWMHAPVHLCEMAVKLKESADLQCSYFFQRVLYKLMENGTLDAHQQRLINAYKAKRDAMLNALATYCKESLHVSVPEGGMFVWATLKEGGDTMELFNEVIKENVAFVPGVVFYPHAKTSNGMRLNFTNASIQEIEEGIKRMAHVLSPVKA